MEDTSEKIEAQDTNASVDSSTRDTTLKRTHDQTISEGGSTQVQMDSEATDAPPPAKKANLGGAPTHDNFVQDEVAPSAPGAPPLESAAVGPTPSTLLTEEELLMMGEDPLASTSTSPTNNNNPGKNGNRPGLNPRGTDSRAVNREKRDSRYKGKKDIRSGGDWGGGREKSKEGEGEGVEEGGDGEKRWPKRKVALFVGYSGSGYNGMQFQQRPPGDTSPPETTIEGLLFSALTSLSLISPANSLDPKKVDLQRAARTDKGVSAAGNVVSLKMVTEYPGLEDEREVTRRVNELLPEDVRLWGWSRTLSGFNARTACDTRVYEYLFPSYMLLPPKPGCKLDQDIKAFVAAHNASLESESVKKEGDENEEKKLVLSHGIPDHPFWTGSSEDEEMGVPGGEEIEVKEEDAMDGVEVKNEEGVEMPSTAPSGEPVDSVKETRRGKGKAKTKGEYTTTWDRKRGWRVSKEELERFREVTKMFVGTHNFHNYTLYKPFNDKTVKRFIISIDVAEPEVYSGMEWISVKIHGQSFMLHQIRKMMALALMATRTHTPSHLLNKTFQPPSIHIPKAPALGLLLESPRFGSFNIKSERITKQNSKNLEGQRRDEIGFEGRGWEEEMAVFKRKWIYERMREEEDKGGIYHNWVTTIDTRGGPALGYLNPLGIIPSTAITNAQKPKNSGSKNKAARREGEGDEIEEMESEEDDVQAGGGGRGVKADDEE